MRILIVHNRYTQRGGEDVVFEAEAALLRQHGHEVYTWEEDNHRLNEQSKISAAANAIWSFASQKTLQEHIERHRPQVVHFHNTFLRISPAAYYTCQQAGLPVVQTLHNYRLICPAATLFRDGKVCEECLGSRGLWPSIQHRCWHDSAAQTAIVASMLTTHRWLKSWQKQVDFFIALTEFARQKYIAGGMPAEKIVVKPNFMVASPEMRSADLPRVPFALFVGRLSPEKGLHLLLDAWQSLPELPLKVVGDGPLRAKLEKTVQQMGLSQVELCGNLPPAEVAVMMQSARFLVMPSNWYEGFPMVLVEAFARRLPVITTRLGSLAEIVRNGENGIHFRPADAADLVGAVRWGWEHPAEMERLAGNAYQEYLAKYTPATNYQMLIDIYERAVTQAALL